MSEHLACRLHPHGELIEDWRAGDVICKECGRVVGERMIDVSSEWRDFGNESDSVSRSRIGAAQNLLYDNAQLETTTSAGTGAGALDEFGRQKYGKTTNKMSSADKALRSGHDAIRAVAARIGLTKKVIDRAFLTYKTCHEKKCLRGRSQDVIVATCIYVACRQEGSTRTIDEISSIAAVTSVEISRSYKKLIRFLPNSTAPTSVNTKDLIPRFCNRMGLKQEALIRRTAVYIAQRANEICDIQGRKPSSIAGASIYLACLAARENISKNDIQKASGASEVVIRDVYKIMLLRATQLFPADFVFKCPIANLPLS